MAHMKRFAEWTDAEFQAAALKCGESNWQSFKEQCFLSEEIADEIIQREVIDEAVNQTRIW
jgi:hypothetical protein